MTHDKKPESVAAAEEVFRKSVEAQYELDVSFVSDICEKFVAAVLPLAEVAASTTPKRRVAGGSVAVKEKKQRKKSSYNVYVREMMKTPKIQDLNHKEKMGAIAECWKALNDDDKIPYNLMAKEENDGSALPVVVEEPVE
jgi:hypothetical protein